MASSKSGDQGAALTPSEWRVLIVLATGASSQQIAETLSISIHTVDKHLTHIYRKLGVSRREQAIRWYDDWLKWERQRSNED